MKKSSILTMLAMAVFGMVFTAQAETFTLTSPQIKEGGTLTERQVFKGFGCDGENVSPALEWKNAPKGTKSFAVTVYDPDAPTGSGWWHWVLFNIPADVTSLPEGAGSAMVEGAGSAMVESAGEKASMLPKGAIQSITDFASPGFGGACPPPGDKAHRYVFTVYALSTPAMELPPTTMPATVGFSMHGNILGKATLTATYGR